jgi:hypothetical protein
MLLRNYRAQFVWSPCSPRMSFKVDSEIQNPAEESGVCKSTGVERGIEPMVLSMLVLILMLIRKLRTKFKLDIEL